MIIHNNLINLQSFAQPRYPRTLDTVTIVPLFSSSIPGRNSRMVWKWEMTFTRKLLD